MIQFRVTRFLLFLLFTVCFNTENKSNFAEGKFFEYELPNRTVTICPTNSLTSIECPQGSLQFADAAHPWQQNLPQYLISIDYIRSFPSRLGHEPNSCQADLSHPCLNYDLRYLNTLCNGKSQCSDIPTYQIRDRSLCAFKAVTEIGFHCVPTWNLREIQTKCDICKNGSLTNDYGFIYSRNYPFETTRVPCFTTIYARPYHKTVLYFVNGELNFDQLRIESVSSDGLTILNITLNGNHSTQRLAMSNYEIKITFIPSHIYSHQMTYYLLYFYTIPICSYNDPCPPSIIHPSPTTTPIINPTMSTSTARMRIQSVGWTRIPNIWIIIPVILAYILLLLILIVLALLFQRRRKQKKILAGLANRNVSSNYLDASGTSSRSQLVTPLPPAPSNPSGIITHSTYHRATAATQNLPYPSMSSPTTFARNMERYHRESRSDFDLHQSATVDYRPHLNERTMSNYAEQHRISRGGYGTMEYPGHRRSSLPKSFSDCDLCKRRVVAEEYADENWHLENTMDRRGAMSSEPRAYREKIKERFRERLSVRQLPESSTSNVEYSTVLPRHQRMASESNAVVHHLPFEYIPSEQTSNVRTVEYKRNGNEERFIIGNRPNDSASTNFTVKFYQHDDDDNDEDLQHRLDRCLHEAREVQEISMRMTDQQQYNRYQGYHQQEQNSRRYHGNVDI